MSFTTRLLIVASLSCSGAMVGLFFSKRLKQRAAYYGALVDFITHLQAQVRFRKDPIKSIAAGFVALSETPFNKNLLEYTAGVDPKALTLSRGVLKPHELLKVQAFLSSLGTLDSDTQLFELEAHKARFSSLATLASSKKKANSSMYIKLGFMAGLALGVIIM